MKIKIIPLAVLLLSTLSNNLLAQQITATGAMSTMAKTGFAPQLSLDTLKNKTHLYGLGPYEKLQGEITIVDGKPFYATAYEAEKSTVSQSWNIKTPFFVQANVAHWQAFEITDDLASVGDIQTAVTTIAKANGYDLNIPFPFKLEGTLAEATCHIVTPRSPEIEGYRENVKQQLFSFKETSGQLIGFYSQNHQGIFTGSKTFIHVHFLKEDHTFMGHLDKVKATKSNLKLFLPAKKTMSGIQVNDTDFSKGKLGLKHEINLTDLEKFHGHLCDGLVVGFLGIKQGLQALYPDGLMDRTNTRIISKSSPCLTDVAVYVSGGRYQFDTFYVEDTIENGLYVIQRIDNGKTVKVNLNTGIKPPEIDKMGSKAIQGDLAACELKELKQLEDAFSQKLLSSNPEEIFTVTKITNFEWKPILKNDYLKTDILNKNKGDCER